MLVVWTLDRLSRSLRDVLTIMERVQERHAGFRSLKEAVDTHHARGSDDDADRRRVRRVRARDAQGTDQGGPRRRAQGRPDRRPAAEAQAPPATGNCDASSRGRRPPPTRRAYSASTRQRCRGYSGGPRSSLLPVLSVPLLPKPQDPWIAPVMALARRAHAMHIGSALRGSGRPCGRSSTRRPA